MVAQAAWPEVRGLSHRRMWLVRALLWVIVVGATLQVVSAVREHAVIEPWRWVVVGVAGALAYVVAAAGWVLAGRVRLPTPLWLPPTGSAEENRDARRALLAGEPLDDGQRRLVAVQVGGARLSWGLLPALVSVLASSAGAAATAGSVLLPFFGVGLLFCVVGAAALGVERRRFRRVQGAALLVGAVPFSTDQPRGSRSLVLSTTGIALGWTGIAHGMLRDAVGLGNDVAWALAGPASLAGTTALVIVLNLVLPTRWFLTAATRGSRSATSRTSRGTRG